MFSLGIIRTNKSAPYDFAFYYRLIPVAQKLWINIYELNENERDETNQQFTQWYQLNHHTDNYITIANPVIDLLRQRSGPITDTLQTIAHIIPIINNLAHRSLHKDKLVTYQTLSDISPLTITYDTWLADPTIIDQYESDQLIIKPRYGTQGNGISAYHTKKIYTLLISNQPTDYLIQEHTKSLTAIIDDIEDIRRTTSDVLFWIINIVSVSIRTAFSGKITANKAQWGTYVITRFFSVTQIIPNKQFNIYNQQAEWITNKQRTMYSIDVGIENDKTYLIELNGHEIGISPFGLAGEKGYSSIVGRNTENEIYALISKIILYYSLSLNEQRK